METRFLYVFAYFLLISAGFCRFITEILFIYKDFLQSSTFLSVSAGINDLNLYPSKMSKWLQFLKLLVYWNQVYSISVKIYSPRYDHILPESYNYCNNEPLSKLFHYQWSCLHKMKSQTLYKWSRATIRVQQWCRLWFGLDSRMIIPFLWILWNFQFC